MDTRFLESLISVVENGSIAAAARDQGLTSAAVSQRIIALEKELGCKLLSRTSHEAKATDACHKIITKARKIIRETDELKSEINSTSLSGKIKIGAISTALTDFLPGVLRKLSALAPEVLPIIIPGTSRDLFEAVKTDRLDAAILVDTPFETPKSLTKFTLTTEPLLFLSNEKISEPINEILKNKPYISYDSKSWGGRLAKSFLLDNKIETKLFCELDALETICILVSKGMGVSLVPQWAGIEQYTKKLYVQKIKDSTYHRKIILLTSYQSHRPQIINLLKTALLEP